MADLSDRGRALEEQWFRENEKQLHFMKCPKCGGDLAEVAHGGVTVDRCGSCEGVFLDAGELEKVLGQGADERRTFFRRLAGLFHS